MIFLHCMWLQPQIVTAFKSMIVCLKCYFLFSLDLNRLNAVFYSIFISFFWNILLGNFFHSITFFCVVVSLGKMLSFYLSKFVVRDTMTSLWFQEIGCYTLIIYAEYFLRERAMFIFIFKCQRSKKKPLNCVIFYFNFHNRYLLLK